MPTSLLWQLPLNRPQDCALSTTWRIPVSRRKAGLRFLYLRRHIPKSCVDLFICGWIEENFYLSLKRVIAVKNDVLLISIVPENKLPQILKEAHVSSPSLRANMNHRIIITLLEGRHLVAKPILHNRMKEQLKCHCEGHILGGLPQFSPLRRRS